MRAANGGPHAFRARRPSIPLARGRLIDGALAVAAVERKRGNLDFEMFAAGSYHAVGADHETRGRLQRNAAGIFEGLSGFEHRLLADNARPPYFLAPTMGIGDAPVAR